MDSPPDAATLHTFDSAFHVLSEQAQATILAEGRPLHLTLPDKDTGMLATSLTHNEAKASASPATVSDITDTIAKVAEAYDYTAEKVNAHLYLLHKRYSDVHDLPCVTYDELLNSVRQMERLCDQYGTHTAGKGSYEVPELAFQSLTPEQVKKAETGVAIGELTADQQQLARAAAVELSVGKNIVQLHQFVHHMTALKSSQTIFLYKLAMTNVQGFGYRGPFGYDNQIYSFPVDNRFFAYSGGYSREIKIIPNMPKTDAEENAAWGPDKTLPTDEDRRALRESEEDKSPYRTSLGTLAHAISHTKAVFTTNSITPGDLPADSKTPTGFTVDAGLASKPLSMYGLKYSSSDAIIRSLASLYQLTLLVPKTRQYQIVLAKVSDRADEAFGVKIAQLIPALLKTARDRQTALAGDEAVKNTEKDDFPPEMLRQDGQYDSALAYYYPADHRLLLLAKPLVPKTDSPPVPLSQADPDVYHLIALMIYVSSCQHTIEELVSIPPPFYLTHPDALVLRMRYVKSTKGGGGLKAEFGYRDEAGEYHSERAQIYSHKTPYPATTLGQAISGASTQ